MKDLLALQIARNLRRIGDHLESLQKDISVVRTRDEEGDSGDKPHPITASEASDLVHAVSIRYEEGQEQKLERKKFRLDKLRFLVECIGLVGIGLTVLFTVKQWHEMSAQTTSMKETLDEAKEQTKAAKAAKDSVAEEVGLLRGQIEMQEARLEGQILLQQSIRQEAPIIDPTAINVTISNRGQSSALKTHGTLSVNLAEIDGSHIKHIRDIEFSEPVIEPPPKNDVHRYFEIFIEESDKRRLGAGELTVVVKGKLTYDTQLGKTVPVEICSVIWGRWLKRKDGRVVGDGRPRTCNEFDVFRAGLPQYLADMDRRQEEEDKRTGK